MTVARILSTKGRAVATVLPEHNLQEAAKVLAQHGIGAVVAVDGDQRVVGILSERDIVRALAKHGPAALDMAVSASMTAKVEVCEDHDTIASLMERMTRGRFRHLPVVQDGKLAGIISIGDVVKARIDEATAESEALKTYIHMAS